jgi:hypothetical protein
LWRIVLLLRHVAPEVGRRFGLLRFGWHGHVSSSSFFSDSRKAWLVDFKTGERWVFSERVGGWRFGVRWCFCRGEREGVLKLVSSCVRKLGLIEGEVGVGPVGYLWILLNLILI